MQTKKGRVYLYICFFLLAIIILYPILITFTNSLMSMKEVQRHYIFEKSHMVLIPDEITLTSYFELLFNYPKYLIYFFNAVKITVPVVCGQMLVSFLAAYTFRRATFKGKHLIYRIYIIVMFLPTQVVLVPHYIVIQKLHLLNHHLALILPGIFNPFGVFLLTQFMRSLPDDYMEAAEIDGASHGQLIYHIFLPLMKSGLFALAILTFIEYWNIVEPALVFLQDLYKAPLSVFLSQISETQMDLVFAASCFYMMPVLILFIYGQDYLIQGIELSGVKG